mmetsp:Transcript_16545/g.21539  ORF Transcript_16545/g.21539 Transcript_16545/m.21539 type:complete len:117 (+) Transcript_16545:480-830(+)
MPGKSKSLPQINIIKPETIVIVRVSIRLTTELGVFSCLELPDLGFVGKDFDGVQYISITDASIIKMRQQIVAPINNPFACKSSIFINRNKTIAMLLKDASISMGLKWPICQCASFD